MNTKECVKAAQAKIIDSLSECETDIAELYVTFSQILPEMRDFWVRLAVEEEGHARMVLDLHKLLDQGYFFRNLGAMETDGLRKLIRDTQNELMNERNCQSSRSHSLGVAIQIESGVLESRFYTVVSSDSPGFQTILERIAADTKRHMETLEREIRNA